MIIHLGDGLEAFGSFQGPSCFGEGKWQTWSRRPSDKCDDAEIPHCPHRLVFRASAVLPNVAKCTQLGVSRSGQRMSCLAGFASPAEEGSASASPGIGSCTSS